MKTDKSGRKKKRNKEKMADMHLYMVIKEGYSKEEEFE